jgi:hypothetical protein
MDTQKMALIHFSTSRLDKTQVARMGSGLRKAFVPSIGTKVNNTVAGFVSSANGWRFPFDSNATDVSEDCLNLMAICPSFAAKDSKLPIMAHLTEV